MEPTWKSSAAGIINIMAAVASLFGALVFGVLALVSTGAGGFALFGHGEPGAGIGMAAGLLIFGGLASIALVMGLVALWGGLEALQRRSWGWAVAGSISTFWILFPVGVLSVIFTLMAEHEFEGRGQTKTFADAPAPHGPLPSAGESSEPLASASA